MMNKNEREIDSSIDLESSQSESTSNLFLIQINLNFFHVKSIKKTVIFLVTEMTILLLDKKVFFGYYFRHEQTNQKSKNK